MTQARRAELRGMRSQHGWVAHAILPSQSRSQVQSIERSERPCEPARLRENVGLEFDAPEHVEHFEQLYPGCVCVLLRQRLAPRVSRTASSTVDRAETLDL